VSVDISTTVRTTDGVLRADGGTGLLRRPKSTDVALSVPSSPAPGRPTPRAQGVNLRAALIWIDVLGFSVAFAVAFLMPMPAEVGGLSAPLVASGWLVAVGTGLVAMRVQRMYLARVCAIRQEEITRTLRAAAVASVGTGLVAQVSSHAVPVERLLTGATLAFVLVAFARGVFSALIRARRARGLLTRPLVLVGTDPEARRLADLLATHPEFGFRISGVVGDRAEHQSLLSDLPYLGPVSRTSQVLSASGDDGVLISASGSNPLERRRLVQELMAQRVHVHLSIGLEGVDAGRIRPLPIAGEPFFYVETTDSRKLAMGAKRCLDVVLGSLLFVLSLPLLGLAMVAIKLDDRGPVFFRQTRVGRFGKPIKVTKLRTMVAGAEAMQGALAEANERDSVLFKLEDDPRRTRVGRLLEMASLDELPQLLNVISGSMSLVGPRPALPAEVALFDEELMVRFDLPPGLTGLWQVQSRDNPSFAAYRRLDLFYVRNWSFTMDVAILFETGTAVAGRLLGKVTRSE